MFSSPVNTEIDFLCTFLGALCEIVFSRLCCQLLLVSVMIGYNGTKYIVSTRTGKYLKI